MALAHLGRRWRHVIQVYPMRATGRRIQVIYLDLLEQKITPVKQKYTRLSKTEYHYENVPNDFEAKIEVDELGFVVDYPSLFVRSSKLNTNYR